jgi:dGTPase
MGILQHSKGQVDVRAGFLMASPSSMEAWVVRVSDSIAYLNHDLDDALRAGLVEKGDLPRIVTASLGGTHGSRIDALVRDLIEHSTEGEIRFGEDRLEAIEALRTFLYERVYSGEAARREEPKLEFLLRHLFERILAEKLEKGAEEREALDGTIDHLAGMTDRYALALFEESVLPLPWPGGASPRRGFAR